MSVATKDYARQYRSLWPELAPALERAFLEEDPILGDALDRFERELAAYADVAHAVGVGSGTDALVLLLRELELPPGCEIITCAHTFSGVVSALLLAGVTPVLVEPDPATGLIDPARAAAAVTPRTGAILAVHLYGHPVELDALTKLCANADLLLIEDVAQAHGARWRDRAVGSFGDASVVSFHPSKNLGAFGDGGAILTGDAALAKALRVRRNLGKDGKYEFATLASNSKLDTIQAVILAIKLRHLEAWVERRRVWAQIYRDALANVGDVVLPPDDVRARHAYHLFVIRTEERERLRSFLLARGVRTGIHYPIAAHRQAAFADRLADCDFPIADAFAQTVVSLPLSHEHERGEIETAADAVRAFFGNAGA